MSCQQESSDSSIRFGICPGILDCSEFFSVEIEKQAQSRRAKYLYRGGDDESRGPDIR